MIIKFHKNFQKSYRELDKNIQLKVDQAIFVFQKNPLDKTLKNHKLKGALKGKRAFSVMGDLRIIFEEINDYVLVIIIDVGTHNQVY